MPIDPVQARALKLAPLTVDVERGRLRFFAKSTGQRNPVYADVEAARLAGYPDLPVPPTFFFSLELEVPDPMGYLTRLGVDLRHVLHGEQSFVYHDLAYAGDTLLLEARIADVYSKKGGVLEFVVKTTEVYHRDGRQIAEASTVIAVRNLEAAT